MASGSVPPGWHPDPAGVAGRRRWWDGHQWTEAVHDDTEAAASDAAARHGAGQPDRPAASGRGRWLLAAAAIVALAVAVSVTAAVLVNGGGSSSEEAGQDPADPASADDREGPADAAPTEDGDETPLDSVEGGPAPASPEDVAATRTVLVLSMPAGSTEQAREAAAETLAERAKAVAAGASVDVDGDELTVTLPGVADAEAGESLIGDSVLSAAAVLETRTPEHPDWPGCVDGDEPAWVCEDDQEAAHLLDARLPMRRPTAVELAEDDALGILGVNVDLADADLDRFTELTSEIACQREAGQPGMMALLAGPRLLIAVPMSPTVECGEGLSGGSVTIALGADSSEDSAERLVDALRSSFDVVPELQHVQVVTE